VLDDVYPRWREETVEEHERPEWTAAAALEVSERIMTAINEAAVINPVNLVALVVLCMPKQAIVEVELEAQLELYIELAKRAPYAPRTGQPALDAAQMIEHCERMRWLERRAHRLGDVLCMDERRAVLASYHRNNILHLFVLPSLIATSFMNRADMTPARLKSLVAELYLCLRPELYLCLNLGKLGAEVQHVIDAMLDLALLEARAGLLARPPDASPRAAQLRLCAEIVQPFLERYYLCVALLLGHGSDATSAHELVKRCRAASEQFALIYALNAPDLFQAALFENWVGFLQASGLLEETAHGTLWFDEATVANLEASLGAVLPEGKRQTLLSLAGAATRPLSGELGRPDVREQASR
jgi:glycerol-3-phosphate O-acyltransferase